MVEQLEGLPGGAIGVRIWGTVTRDEYDTAIAPMLEAALAGDGPIRYLLQVGPDFDGLEAGALWEDTKEGLKLIGTHSRWERTAVVSEVDWINSAINLFHWMIPGDVRVFPYGERSDAEAWVAET
jgi:hypothetical protein